MKGKDLLSVADLAPEDLHHLLDRAQSMKDKKATLKLQGKVLALLFEKPSLRTRVSFEVAMLQLGGHAVYLTEREVGIGKREPIADAARVLSRYVDAIAVRTFAQATVEELAHHATIPVINALSDAEHPCQALADLLTIREKRGQLQGVTLAYIGDANNVARSLLLACALAGVHFHIASPPGYELNSDLLAQGQGLAARTGSHILSTHQPAEAVAGADVVYTDVWTSMGQESESATRRKAFAAYQVTPALLAQAGAGAIFMHPLPAHHGEEVAAGLLDSPASVVFDQAENRLHMQKAILAELLGRS